MTTSFARLTKVTASTKRNPLTGGARTGYAAHLASLKITPLAPVETSRAAEFRQLLKMGTSYRILECYAQGNPDVDDGDMLVVGAKEYPVRAVLPWTFGDDVRLNIIVEDLVA